MKQTLYKVTVVLAGLSFLAMFLAIDFGLTDAGDKAVENAIGTMVVLMFAAAVTALCAVLSRK